MMVGKAESVTESTILTEAYECDYERNCTPLYKAIETAEEEDEYEAILDFLESGVWSGPFEGIGGPSPLEQVKTWVTRFDPNDETKVKWSQLPLHLAIVCGAPAQIVASLVKLYPEALRCTDDQHMLPLHLALRHESDDEVVAFLLIQFPESVNARGKNGRTAVDCALRAKDKLRGIMLEIFTEKTAAKITAQMTKEKKELMNELENRTSELLTTEAALEAMTKENEALKGSVTTSREIDVEAIEKVRADTEAEYQSKIEKLEQRFAESESIFNEKIEKMKSEKLLHDVVAQKKIDQLLALVKEKEAAEQKARAEEIAVKRELESVQLKVADSKNASEWKAVKEEVETLKAYRLEKTRSETQSTIKSLKGELERSIELSKKSDEKLKSELKDEMKKLKQIVENLQKTESAAKTSSELTALRNEVDVLRAELKERAQAKQTKVELAMMKKSLEVELHNAEGKTHDELEALKKAIETVNASDLEKKTAKELNAMKEEFETLKLELREKELATKTKQDVDELKETLEREMMNADSKTKAELKQMKTIVDSLQATLASNRSTDEMVSVKQEVEALKDEFKKKEAASKIKLEAAMLKKMVEAELKQSEGKTQVELLQMKKAIKDLTAKALENNNDVEELSRVRSELTIVKDELKEIEKISKTQQELEELRFNLEQQIKNSKGKTEEELLSMKRALDAISTEHLESRELKRALEEEIKNASGKTEQELKSLKKSIEAIDLRKLEAKNQTEWTTIRKEMDILTAFLKKKQQDGVGETQSELRAVKQAVAAIDLSKIETQHRSEFDSLRNEMETMKREMKQKEAEEAELKRELDSLKQASQKKKKGLRAFFFSRGFVNEKQRNPAGSNKLASKLNTVKADEVESKKEISVETKGEEFTTILPPSLTMTNLSSPTNNEDGTNNVSPPASPNNGGGGDISDDASWSSAMKDAEKSRIGKVKELSLMQSKSRDNGELSSPKSRDEGSISNALLEMSEIKSTKSRETTTSIPSLGNKSSTETEHVTNRTITKQNFPSSVSVTTNASNSKEDKKDVPTDEGEILTIVSLQQSKSMLPPRGGNSTSSYTLKKVKSEGGKFSIFSSDAQSITETRNPRSILKTSGGGGGRSVASAKEESRDINDIGLGKPPRVLSMKGSKNAILLRKVKSMEPKYALESSNASYGSSRDSVPYELTTTRSKPIISDNGEVELHVDRSYSLDEGDEDDEDHMIHPRVSFVSHFE